MEQKLKTLFAKLSLFFVFVIANLNLIAQDGGTGSGTTTTTTMHSESSSSQFHVEPWMWIVGGVVLLVLLVALIGGRSSVKETTVIKER
jgi:hypothetical protein